jgi:two-component system KDP operon response regulator KdpE
VDREQGIQRVARIAVLCPQPRLRRLLRVSLLADGYEVVEWSTASRPKNPGVDAVVADLDSLRQEAQDVLTLLREWCVAEATALLFISVYPLELRSLRHGGPYDELQPPYPPDELSDRIRRLLERTGSGPDNLDRSTPRRRDGGNGTASDPACSCLP